MWDLMNARLRECNRRERERLQKALQEQERVRAEIREVERWRAQLQFQTDRRASAPRFTHPFHDDERESPWSPSDTD